MRKRAVIVAVIGLLLVITVAGLACKGKTSPTNDTPVVRLGYLQGDFHDLPVMVALDQGFFAQAGLDVEVGGVFASGPEEMSAFASESLDLGYVGLAPVVTAKANGAADVVILALNNTEGSALVLRPGLSLAKAGDLAGKTIAIPGLGSVQNVLLIKVLNKAGLSMKDVTSPVMKPPEMVSALRNKQIDGFIAWEPFPAQAAGMVYLNSHDIWPDHPCCVMVVSRRFYQQHPEAVGKLIQANSEAIDWIEHHPDEAASIAHKYIGLSETVIKTALKNIKYGGNLRPDQVEDYVQTLNSAGLINIPNPGDFSRLLVEAGLPSQGSDPGPKQTQP